MMHSIHFYIQLCGTIWLYGKIGRGNIQLLFLISSKDSFIFTIPIDRIMHIIAFVTSVAEHWLERERGSTSKGRFDDLLHHEWMLYHSLLLIKSKCSRLVFKVMWGWDRLSDKVLLTHDWFEADLHQWDVLSCYHCYVKKRWGLICYIIHHNPRSGMA